jgi:pyruvate formate lyase activating enzyme
VIDNTPTGIVFRIERFAIHDGPGIRTTVFLKGCPLRCVWCHSPESQSPRPEFMPPPDRCIACGSCVAACPEHAIVSPGAPPATQACRLCGTCVDVCPAGARLLAGESMSVASVVEAVERDRVFYDESAGGVTVSGGEPLMQPEFLAALVDECRARALHVAVDTCGFGDPAALERVKPDLFLFDVKATDADRHRAMTGVSSDVILANLARVAARQGSAAASPGRSNAGRLIVRFPLIPGVNDDDDNVRSVGRLVSSLQIGRIDVLPYHRAGLAKYARLGRACPLPATEPPSADGVARVVQMLSEYRLNVRVGGS